ncbi:MAG TPA: T9SS type A sorting domain-containing protein, partial [Niabella sp.]|nr:T9SS type A sorting domain-containing protein [Niabella sp.]
DVSGNCNGGTINNVNVLTAKIDSNNFINTYGAILPVILDYFKAGQKQPNVVHLEWASLSELNHSKFIVERSPDQQNWSSIGSVSSLGNSTIRKVYQLIDQQPLPGTNYYRLKQVDLDGGTSYSPVARINTLFANRISVFPNPVADVANLYGKESFKPTQTVQVIDAKGTRIKMITPTGGNRLQIDLSGYSAGLYLVQVIESGKVIENLQIVKQ